VNASGKLVKFCEKIGARVPVWTQGGGGNVSVKDSAENLLYIKASGARLGDVSLQTGIAAARLSDSRVALRKLPKQGDASERAYAELLASVSLPGPHWGRLSMEAGFHALLPKTFVLHFHSLPALLMAHEARKQPNAWKKWLNANVHFSLSILPFINPGASLSFALADAHLSDVYLLDNHGLVAQTEDAGEFLSIWEELERVFCRDFGYGELLALLESKDSLNLARKMHGGPGAFAILLPDVAVFEQKIRSLLEPSGNLFLLKSHAWQTDPGTCELWLAIQILLRAAPDIASLSAAQGDHVAQLPSEKFRKEK
jgi:hypothetical protein